MTLTSLISALTKRGASEANLRAGSELQICVDGQWRAQNANLTDAALDEMIARALPLDQETAWRSANGTANFSAQSYSIEASKSAGAVTIKIKRSSKASGGPLTAQTAGELKNSAFANSNAFAPVAPTNPQPASPPTAATPPALWPKSAPATPAFTVAPAVPAPPPMPVAAGDWYYCKPEGAQQGLQRGPFSLEQMRNLVNATTLKAGTLVWKDGMGSWLPLAQTELGQFLPRNHAPDSYNAPPMSPPQHNLPYQPPPPTEPKSSEGGNYANTLGYGTLGIFLGWNAVALGQGTQATAAIAACVAGLIGAAIGWMVDQG